MPVEKDYTKDIYDYLGTLDNTYQKDVSLDKFRVSMKDKKYAADIHSWIGSVDASFPKDVHFDTFFNSINKKKNSASTGNVLQNGSETPLQSTSSSPSNLELGNPINTGRPRNLEEFNRLYGENYANLKTGERINPFTADKKILATNKPLTAVEVMQLNNKVALERLEVKKAKLAKLKELKALKAQEPELIQKSQDLKAAIQDPSLPYETRVAAQAELKNISDIFDNAGLDIEKLNNLNEIDKALTNRINSNETIRQQRLEKEYGQWQNLVESTGKALVKLPSEIVNMGAAISNMGESIINPEMAAIKKRMVRKALKPIDDFADSLISQETPDNYKDWFSGKFSAGKLGYLASEAIGQTLPTVAAGFLTGGVGSVVTGSAMAFEESRNILLEAGLTENQADAGALGLAVPLGLLEKYGIEDIIKKPIGKKILKETADEVISILGKSDLGNKITAQMVFSTTKRTLGNVIKKYGEEVLGAAWKEPITEMAQAGVNELGKQAAESYSGKDSNAEQSNLDYLKETGKSILGEGLSGALGGVGLSAVTSAFQSRTNPSAYDRALELKDQDLYEDFISQMQDEVSKGIITEEQMNLAIKNVAKIQETDAKIPSNIVGAERRSAAASLIAKKEELETEIEGKDKTLVAPITAEIDQIDQTLSEIAQGIPMEDIESNIEKMQEKLNLPTSPEVVLSNESKVLFNEMENGKPLSLESIEKLSGELYQRYKGINGLKGQSNKRFTDKQIEEQLGKIEEDITLLENAKSKLLETNEKEIIINPNSREQANVINEVEDTINSLPSEVFAEIDLALHKEGIAELVKTGQIEYVDDVTKQSCLRYGGRGNTFNRGSQWEIIKDLKGYKPHEKGGVDLSIGKNGVEVRNGESKFYAKNGLLFSDGDPIEKRIAPSFSVKEGEKIKEHEKFLSDFIQSPKYKEMLLRQYDGDEKAASENIKKRLEQLELTKYDNRALNKETGKIGVVGQISKNKNEMFAYGDAVMSQTIIDKDRNMDEYPLQGDVHLSRSSFEKEPEENYPDKNVINYENYPISANVPLHEMTHRSLGENAEELITPYAKEKIKNVMAGAEEFGFNLGNKKGVNPDSDPTGIGAKNVKKDDYWHRPTEVLARLNSFRKLLLDNGVYDPKTENIDAEKYNKFKDKILERQNILKKKRWSSLTEDEIKEWDKIIDIDRGFRYMNDTIYKKNGGTDDEKRLWMLNNLVKNESKGGDYNV